MEANSVEVVDATQYFIDQLKGRLRKDDEIECWAMAHISADDGLQRSFDSALHCWVVLLGGVPILAFGVGRPTLLGGVGRPWLLATDDMMKVKRQFIRECRGYIDVMLTKVQKLENWVDVRNTLSIRWLTWCGFKLEKPAPYGPDKMLFHHFTMTKEEK